MRQSLATVRLMEMHGRSQAVWVEVTLRRLLTSTRQQSIPLTNLRRGIMASNLTDLMGALPDDWRDGRFVGRIDRGEGLAPSWSRRARSMT